MLYDEKPLHCTRRTEKMNQKFILEVHRNVWAVQFADLSVRVAMGKQAEYTCCAGSAIEPASIFAPNQYSGSYRRGNLSLPLIDPN